MKIRIVIPLWKRPLVTRFCFDGLVKLIRETKHELKVTCVISEEYYEVVCKAYGFDFVYAENDPLGAKINTGIAYSLANEYDYLMMMNSDDIIKAELLDKYYEPFFESLNPLFGINKVTYVNFATMEAREYDYEYTLLGIGKCIRRDIVLSMRGNLYPDRLNKCLDDNMMDIMAAQKVFPTFVKYEGQLAMDFKSETNIWPWSKFKNRGTAVCYKHEQ